MARFFREYKDVIIEVAVAIVVFGIIAFLFGGIVKTAAEQPVHTNEYKVLTVYQYSAPITNGYGGVRGHETMYHVTYLNDKGVVCEKEMYNGAAISDTPYEAVYMGEETKLVVKTKGSTDWHYLYLTQEDFEQMQYKLIEN